MAWTDEMIEQLIQLWQSGLTTNDIAKELGMSKNSIVGKVHRLNLEARPSPIKKKEEEVTVSEEKSVKKEKNTPQQIVIEFEEQVEKIKVEKQEKPENIEQKPVVHTHKRPVTCVKLSELDSHTCRWPIGDPKDEDFCFCGKKVRPGQTYCDEHAAIAYVKPIKK